MQVLLQTEEKRRVSMQRRALSFVLWQQPVLQVRFVRRWKLFAMRIPQ